MRPGSCAGPEPGPPPAPRRAARMPPRPAPLERGADGRRRSAPTARGTPAPRAAARAARRRAPRSRRAARSTARGSNQPRPRARAIEQHLARERAEPAAEPVLERHAEALLAARQDRRRQQVAHRSRAGPLRHAAAQLVARTACAPRTRAARGRAAARAPRASAASRCGPPSPARRRSCRSWRRGASSAGTRPTARRAPAWMRARGARTDRGRAALRAASGVSTAAQLARREERHHARGGGPRRPAPAARSLRPSGWSAGASRAGSAGEPAQRARAGASSARVAPRPGVGRRSRA